MRWILCFRPLASPVYAEQVSITWGELQLNANFVRAESDLSQPLFLVLHGIEGTDHFFRDLFLDDILDEVVEAQWLN